MGQPGSSVGAADVTLIDGAGATGNASGLLRLRQHRRISLFSRARSRLIEGDSRGIAARWFVLRSRRVAEIARELTITRPIDDARHAVGHCAISSAYMSRRADEPTIAARYCRFWGG